MAPSDDLAARIVELDPEDRPALIRRLYRERGWSVTTVDAPGGWVGLRVVSPGGRHRRLLVAVESAPKGPETAAADRVIRLGDTDRGSGTEVGADTDEQTTTGRVVDAAAVAEQVRYALTTEAQRRLARTLFDTDRATLLDSPTRTRDSPTRPQSQSNRGRNPAGTTPVETDDSTRRHTPAATDGATTADATGVSDTDTATSEQESESESKAASDGSRTRRQWVVFAGLLFVGVVLAVLAAGGPLSALGGVGADDGGEAASIPAFDPGGPPEARGVSGLTPTPGSIAAGPDRERGVGDESGDDDDTVANATTRGDTTTQGSEPTPASSRVPGVTADGAVDETVLAERTAAALTNHSYRFVAVYREEVDGETTARLREVARVENDSRYVSRVSRLGEPVGSPQVIADTTVSARDGRVVQQVVGDGVVQRDQPAASDPFRPRVAQYVGWYLGVESSTVVDSERRNGHQRLLLRLRGDPWPGVENTTGSAVVTDTGVVRSVTRRYTLPGRPNVTATVTVRVTDIGETTVDPELDGTSERRDTRARAESGNEPERRTAPDTQIHYAQRSAVASQSHRSSQSTVASQSHRSSQSTVASQSHHSTRYAHRSPPSARQVAPTSVVVA